MYNKKRVQERSLHQYLSARICFRYVFSICLLEGNLLSVVNKYWLNRILSKASIEMKGNRVYTLFSNYYSNFKGNDNPRLSPHGTPRLVVYHFCLIWGILESKY